MPKNVIPHEEDFLTNLEPVVAKPSREPSLAVVDPTREESRGGRLSAAKPTGKQSPGKRSSRQPSSTASKAVDEPPAGTDKRTRQTLHIRQSVMDRARNCVYWLEGPPDRLTLGELAERGLLSEIERLERIRNDGNPFAPRGAGLRGGRRVSVD